METYAKTGLTAFEPSFNSPEEVLTAHKTARNNGISIPSAYVNSLLHDKDKAQKSVDEALEIAANFKKSGTRILVTNPTPIKWGRTKTKSDEELKLNFTTLK